MGYQSSRRRYTSRLERYNKSLRVFRIILLFSLAFAAVYLFWNRYEWYYWLRTFFY